MALKEAITGGDDNHHGRDLRDAASRLVNEPLTMIRLFAELFGHYARILHNARLHREAVNTEGADAPGGYSPWHESCESGPMSIVKSLIKISLAKKAFNLVTRKARTRRSTKNAGAAPAARKRK